MQVVTRATRPPHCSSAEYMYSAGCHLAPQSRTLAPVTAGAQLAVEERARHHHAKEDESVQIALKSSRMTSFSE